MPKVKYKTMKLKDGTLRTIAQAVKILEVYAAKGYKLTLRQLYYQFVGHDLFPDDRRWRWTGSRWVKDPDGTKNADPNYKWLGNAIDSGRLCGLIDWSYIEDRTRNLEARTHFEQPDEVIEAAFHSYRIDRWARQDVRPEVWIEKEALSGIFERVCRKWDVPLFACRGYTSQSEMWSAAQRLHLYRNKGQQPIILHFGDHDPSGIDMTRDIQDRMGVFKLPMEVQRLALNMDQIEQYSPPPNPAKSTDARFRSYRAAFGNESWELDALEPEVMVALVEKAIAEFRDDTLWHEDVDREIEERSMILTAYEHWNDVSNHLEKTHRSSIEENQKILSETISYAHEVGDTNVY